MEMQSKQQAFENLIMSDIVITVFMAKGGSDMDFIK
jgi:hypothetical protein